MILLTKEHKENWKNWLDALSGNYKQGKKKLHNVETNCFCCLGVACDLFKQPFQLIDAASGQKKVYLHIQDTKHDERFSDQMVGISWFRNKFGFLPFYDEHKSACLAFLAEKNDDGLSFSEIVSMLKKELKDRTDYYEVD